MKKRISVLFTAMLWFVHLHAASAVINSSISCDVNNVRLTSVTNVGSNVNLLSNSYNATECAAYNGNDDQSGVSEPNPNIGQLGDGLLNGEGSFDYFQFVDNNDLQALDLDGINDDPGWIHLANLDADFSPTYSSIGPAPLGNGSTISPLQLSQLLDIGFSCTSGSTGDCNAGTWSLTILNVNNIIETVQNVLGRAALFDQLAISIKTSSFFGVYNFDFKDIFAAENNPNVLNLQTPYNLGGTFNTADLDGKGVSHINVWARDPAQTTEVSAPPLALLFVGAVTLIISIRRRH